MIIGVGTDIVRIDRIKRLIEKYNQMFLSRILCSEELKKIEKLPVGKLYSFVAKRFAAKEAISKAFGIGIGQYLQFKTITIINDELGRPLVVLNSTKIKDIRQFRVHLSMSDDYPNALAFAILIKQPTNFKN